MALAVHDLTHWSGPATSHERDLLVRMRGPVLDIGCGPGRLVAALHDARIEALGIDAAPAAVARAHALGRIVALRSVFDVLPHAAWNTVLLFDGNIGIGGDAVRLLARVRELLAPGGTAVVELDQPGQGVTYGQVEYEVATGMVGQFPWCWVAADEIAALASRAGLRVVTQRTVAGRWFGWLATD